MRWVFLFDGFGLSSLDLYPTSKQTKESPSKGRGKFEGKKLDNK